MIVQPGCFPATPQGEVQKTVSGGRLTSQPDVFFIAFACRASRVLAPCPRMPHEALPTGPQDRQTARRLLARMDRMEEFARQYEEIDRCHPDLPNWELECQRQNFAATYRRLVGVHPDDRERLRSQLLGLAR